ncbi:hypothetical protein PG984_011663 [Apiospora sp. TS-2023a]
MTDAPNKSGGGIKDKPLNDDEKLLLRMIGTMRPGFAMKDWAAIASKRSMTDNQAKQRFEKRRDKFVAEDAHARELRYPSQSNAASGPTSGGPSAPVTRQARQGPQGGSKRAVPHDEDGGGDDGEETPHPPAPKRARATRRPNKKEASTDPKNDVEEDDDSVSNPILKPPINKNGREPGLG